MSLIVENAKINRAEIAYIGKLVLRKKSYAPFNDNLFI